MSTTATLTIACAKPGCHWKGPPAEAPTHACPTPLVAGTTEERFLDDDAAAVDERQELFEILDGAGVTVDRATTTDGLRELVALTTGRVVEPPAGDAIAYDADPTSRDDLEAWLGTHGMYDDQGVPQDEKTATLDARYSSFAAADPEPELDELDDITAIAPEPDPDPATPAPVVPLPEPEEETEQIAAAGGDLTDYERESFEMAQGREVDSPALGTGSTPRAWETVIAEELEQQPRVKECRWLVVWKPEGGREAALVGRGKVKTEAVVIQEDVLARGTLTGLVEVHKTADVLQAAAEIEKRRELVDEPTRTVEAEPEADDPDDPEPEIVQEPEAPAPGEPGNRLAAATGKPALFDASDYDREDLALPKVDGHAIDRIAVKFAGSIMLDRSSPDDVALYRRLTIGKETELWVTAKGTGVATKGATNREGDLDVMVGERSVTITTIRILGPEDLDAAALEVAAQARDAAENEDARQRVPADG